MDKFYLLYKQYTNDLCNYYKQNFDEIFKFKSDLRDDLCDFIRVVEGFEDQIKQCNKDRETMIKTNNDIIKFKNEEKEKLNERINALNYDLEKQKIKLDKINSTLNEYKSQNENYINKITIHSISNSLNKSLQYSYNSIYFGGKCQFDNSCLSYFEIKLTFPLSFINP